MRYPAVWFILGALLAGSAACTSAGGKVTPGFTLTSRAFGYGERIPASCTCEGANQSPALTWSGAPEGTRSLTLICNDPDAPVGTWVHWLLYNIPPAPPFLHPGIPADRALTAGGMNGLNSWQDLGYGGPCPPPGKPHRYFFILYALDSPLDLGPGATQAQVEAAMKGHTLGKTELMGLYGR